MTKDPTRRFCLRSAAAKSRIYLSVRHSVKRSYPLQPKSAITLLCGEFWAIPLADGNFGCGVVVSPALNKPGASRTLFLAGLLDWRGSTPPTANAIASSTCFAQAKLHYEGIAYIGAKVIGVRLPGSVALEPWYFRGAECADNSHIQHGLELLRPQTAEDSHLPVIGVWGYEFPRLLIERRFLKSVQSESPTNV